MDECTSHKTSQVMKLLLDNRCIVSILPGGSTSRIQVLDVGVNKPFKGQMRTRWTEFMIENVDDSTKVVTRLMLANWVIESWAEIEAASIIRTFNSIGFY